MSLAAHALYEREYAPQVWLSRIESIYEGLLRDLVDR
jgi:hypothetical protein